MSQKTLEKLDAKALHVYTKNGWTEKDFCKNYGLTRKRFWDKVDSIIPEKGVRAIRRSIRRNGHLQSRRQMHRNTNKDDENLTVKKISNTTDIEEQSPAETKSVDVETCVSKMPDTTDAKLLAKKEKQIAKKQLQMQALVNSQDALNARKAQIQQDELPQLRQELEKCLRKIRKLQKEAGSLENELRKLNGDKDEIADTISATKGMLTDLQQTRHELQTVSILCYESGEIDIISAPDKEELLDVKGDWIEIVTHNPDECSSLTNGQIRGIANILEIVRTVNFWQVEFENVQTKKLFEKLIEEEPM